MVERRQQIPLDFESDTKSQGPVECLGMTFESDKARREYFLEKLKEKLKDPDFRGIEGFPIGEDEDILALSDPPYYTACPNPFIEDFIQHHGEQYDPEAPYVKEPFAADVREGKNDPIYNAHSYHTKAPHKAIMRYILHYTEPGDIVFDGFCGTGMTGVAAQLCGDRSVVESLGYQVKTNGAILRKDTDDSGKSAWIPFSKLGPRRAILNDLSPAATFIAYNYNTPLDPHAFELEAGRILKEVEDECGWMFETRHGDGKKGRINYTLWSDVFTCPQCSRDVVFWDAAVDKKARKVLDVFPCPHCRSDLTKRSMERAWTTKYDKELNKTIRQARQTPVIINYSIPGVKGRYEKTPDEYDLALIEKIEAKIIPYWFPIDRMTNGQEARRNDPIGITHIHHFYTNRNLWVLAALIEKSRGCNNHAIKQRIIFSKTASERITSKLASIAFSYFFHGGGGFINAGRKGTLYISSVVPETPAYRSLNSRIRSTNFSVTNSKEHCCSTQSMGFMSAPSNSLDYIFLDPPFGSNINYSELSFPWEAWLKVLTNNLPEAIVVKSQNKGLDEYRYIMTTCFREAYRMLKPGRWMTVEFSNTKATVWNSIQTALTEAGFIVANVSALDKKQGSVNAYTTSTAVRQDLVISAYKPNGGFEERFLSEASSEEGVWDFVRTHLKYLPVFKKRSDNLVPVPERDPRILFDQMVAYYVRKGYPVPLSSQEFQLGLTQRFPERDGMYFLQDQALEYDKKRLTVREVLQLQLFVSDEASAIQWLKQRLSKKPQTFQDIHPIFLKEISGWRKHEKPMELSELLEQNFLRYDGKGEAPSQIHDHLSIEFKELRNRSKSDPALKAKGKDRWYVPDPNKAGDLEKLREKALLKEFRQYAERTKKFKRNEAFRLEAVRAGFKKAWQERDYGTIIQVARKIPDKILQEDHKLLMWYDQALTREEEKE